MQIIRTFPTVAKNKLANTKSLRDAKKKHEEFIANMLHGKSNKGKSVVSIPVLKSNRGDLSNTIPGTCAKNKSVLYDHLWKTEEKKETIREINNKANRVGTAYNKGGLQYLTDGHDPTRDGRRR